MTENAVEAPELEPGVYEAGEGLAYDVYGITETVEDIDGSLVEIERAYPDAPRRQSYLGVGERGHLVEDAAPAAG